MPVATWEEDIRDVLFKETPEIFCIAGDFCKVFDAQMAKYTFKAARKRKNRLNFRTFLPKLLHKSNKSRTFVLPEPAKPLNDAQMSGSFFLYAYDRKNTIWQTLYRRTESYHSSPIKGIVDNRCEQG